MVNICIHEIMLDIREKEPYILAWATRLVNTKRQNTSQQILSDIFQFKLSLQAWVWFTSQRLQLPGKRAQYLMYKRLFRAHSKLIPSFAFPTTIHRSLGRLDQATRLPLQPENQHSIPSSSQARHRSYQLRLEDGRFPTW